MEISDHTLIPISYAEDGFDNLMREVSKLFGDISIKNFIEIYDKLEETSVWSNSYSQVSDCISGSRNKLYFNNNIRIEKD
jgi:uncharacterized protein YfbU (UPF0304 family)